MEWFMFSTDYTFRFRQNFFVFTRYLSVSGEIKRGN